eukprot:Em0004g1316a
MMWLKDGTQLFGDDVRVVINTSNSTIGTSNRTVSFVRIFNFSQSDAGVYQCVFYDTPSQGGEVVTTRPYKVDTGPIYLNGVSPTVVTLSPPDPLVIQVEAGGEYAGIQWTRTPIALNASKGELVDFQQTFYVISSKPLTPKDSDKIALAIASSVGVTISAAVLLTAVTVTAVALSMHRKVADESLHDVNAMNAIKIAGSDIVTRSSNHSILLLGRSRYEETANFSEDEDRKEDVAEAKEDRRVLPLY